jgi:hypothetical protein
MGEDLSQPAFHKSETGCIPTWKTGKNQGISKVREKSGNFVIGQGIFIVFVVNIILQKFAILALIFMLKKKKFFLLAMLAM